jgi:hypothetical protein
MATADRIWSGLMLSSRISAAPAARASPTWSSVSHSTSTTTPGAAARTARNAAVIPPAAAMWLSLISAASPRPIRWFTPPPQRTAYFSSARSPGTVLRVSRTNTPVPSMASTHARVAVAMPDRWVRKLSSVRSAVRISASGPSTRATTSPAATRPPSRACGVNVAGGQAASSTAAATGRPAKVPGWRATTSATEVVPGGMTAAVVTSGP